MIGVNYHINRRYILDILQVAIGTVAQINFIYLFTNQFWFYSPSTIVLELLCRVSVDYLIHSYSFCYPLDHSYLVIYFLLIYSILESKVKQRLCEKSNQWSQYHYSSYYEY
jgi:hypothetical protein